MKNIPARFLHTDIILAFNIPMPAGDSGITFPLMEGRILEAHEDCIVFQNAKGEEMVMPIDRIQHILKASAISRPSISGIVLPGKA